MKKLNSVFIIVAAMLIVFSQVAIYGQGTPVDQWGATSRGSAWPILNDVSTPAGNGSMGIDTLPSGTAWGTIRGGFDAIEADSQNAVVVTGKIEWVGGDLGNSYIPIRYALTYQDSIALTYQNTDSAKWVSIADSAKEKIHQGYEFTPRSGTGDLSSGSGGAGTLWLVNGGGWNSTYSNGGYPIATAQQVPRNAVVKAGVYNFAISVQPLTDSTSEVRWYLISEDNTSYWFGGTAVDTNITSKFNGVCFGVTNEHLVGTGVQQINLTDVNVELGEPITVPLPPFTPFYVDQWGATNRGSDWPILNDSTTLSGNGSMGIPGEPTGTAWATIRAGFNYPVEATTDEALIVTGKIEWVGGDLGNSYIPIRYALTYQEGDNTLENQYTDSAMWSGTGIHQGYEFTPRSGTGDLSSGSGGAGTLWLVNGGGWNSTYSNGGYPIATVQQVPRNAVVTAGTYNFAFSVQPLTDSTSEVRWYLISEDNTSYWFGGTAVDTNITSKFNGVCFGVTNEHLAGTGVHQLNFIDVHVSKGNPITVPLPPFTPFYVDQWGATNRGSDWPILNDSTTLAGNASMGIPGEPTGTAWATIRGGFNYPVEATTDKALIVMGKIEWVGGDLGNSYIPIRYALTYQDGDNALENQYTDSAMWSGTGTHQGYEFTPRSGTGDLSSGSGGSGTLWLVNGGGWNSTYSNGGYPITTAQQAPRNAVVTAGTYNFAFSVQPLGNNTNEVRWYLIKTDNSYWFGGTAIDTAQITTKFNGVCFGVTNEHLAGTGVHQLNFIDIHVSKGDPITVPVAPWQAFYISIGDWGLYGDPSVSGWTLTKGSVDGNASISGSGAVATNQWASVRGDFGGAVSLTDHPDTALVVTGKMAFVGGGFDGMNGLRFGLFYSDSAGVVDSTAYGPAWSGNENYNSGYLFAPNSGNNGNPAWGSNGNGSVGGVVNTSWLNTDGADNYVLGNQMTPSLAGAGTYDFKLTFEDMGSGQTAVGYSIKSSSYLLEGHIMDSHSPLATTIFNSINFAVGSSNASTTGLNLIDVKVDLGSPITVGVDNTNNNSIPTVYSLNQNYPNPFNPTTTIEFALPMSGNVNLAVYDILGRKVADLVNGNLTAGYHTINFNASDLSSGVYFYRIEAGDFVSVKKLMLLK